MILALPDRLDKPTNLWVSASIELPSAVVQISVHGKKRSTPVSVIAPGATLDDLLGCRFEVDNGQLGQTVVECLEEFRIKIRANHVVPWITQPDSRIHFPILCGNFYAPISEPCSACLVLQDFLLEVGLLEEIHAANAPREGNAYLRWTLNAPREGNAYLRWTLSASDGGRTQQRPDGLWDWNRLMHWNRLMPGGQWHMREENAYLGLTVTTDYAGLELRAAAALLAQEEMAKVERRRAKAENEARMKLSSFWTPGRRKGRKCKKLGNR